MKKNNTVAISVVIASILLSAWFLKDSFFFYSKNPVEREAYLKTNPSILKRIFNLGLDLQGGMRLVLEVDKSNLTKAESETVLDRAYTVIENRVNGLGVAEPSIQKQGTDRLIVELPGLKDETAAKKMIGSTAQLEFKLLREAADLERAIRVIDAVVAGKKTAADSASQAAATDTSNIKEEEAQLKAEKLFAGSESTDSIADSSKSTAETIEAKPTSFSELLQASRGEMIGVREGDKGEIDAILNRKDVRDALERNGLGSSEFLWGHQSDRQNDNAIRPLYYVKSKAELRGDVIKTASATIDQSGLKVGQAQVELELNGEGTRTFARVTGMNINKYLAIILDNTVYSAPTIQQKIAYGRAQITGSFTMDEAKNLAVVLQAGALPAPVNIIEERTVGPSLGQDSIKSGINAGIIGTLLIFVFIVIYYKASGVYACIALVLNAFLVMAIMAGINGTLTLPGIAGIILNLGMAVDANVLICERIREELAVGKTVKSAIEAGYNRAFITIMDSNLTTLLTAFILLWIGTGPIKGFAVTLIFGLIISMFTALFVTHVLYNVFTPRSATKLSI